MIATIEEVSLNALPALKTFFYDGWIVRMSKGYSRRANSVQTFQMPVGNVEEKIAYCEALYRQNDLPVVFKMTPASQPKDLDGVLEQRGYHIEGRTMVQTCSLDTFSTAPGELVRISERWDEEWYEEYCRMNQPNPAQRETLKKMLQLILPKTAFTLLDDGTRARACGLGVLQEEYLGLFDIVVDPAARRRGYGKQLVSTLMDWGRQNGASTAYLQVVKGNEPAINLYGQLGFVEQYPYWYRVRV